MDPQQRVFLECCWEALEDAGYDPLTYAGAIGVYAGCTTNTYFLQSVCSDREFIKEYVGSYPLGNYQTMLGAIVDTLAGHLCRCTGYRNIVRAAERALGTPRTAADGLTPHG